MSLRQYAEKITSQNGEDGIIKHLLDVLGEGTRVSVEIGFSALEANTLNLVNNGWHGIFIDQSPIAYVIGSAQWVNRKDIKVLQVAVTRDNVESTLISAGTPKKFDVLSIDVDGIDYYLWQGLKQFTSRITVIEYNASMGPERSIAVRYHPEFNRLKRHPYYHGASLQALTKLAAKKGLKLVGTEPSGINAFFVEEKAPISKISVEEAYTPHCSRPGDWRKQLKIIERYGLVEI